MTARRAVVPVLTCLLLAACAGPPDRTTPSGTASPSAAAHPTATGSAGPAWSTCTDDVDGYAVDHPADWQVADDPGPCRWFHPGPVPGPDETQVAVRLTVVPHDLQQVRRLEQGGPHEVVTEAERPAGERPGLRQELRAAGGDRLRAGTLSTRWLVDLGPRTLLATASATARGDHARHVEVLDAMMASLRRVEASAAPCSAHGLPRQVEPQRGLPPAVQDSRSALYGAAAACDYRRLAALVPEEGFTYGFGGGDDPVGAWRRQEARRDGDPPLRYLAEVLRRPYAVQQVQGRTLYAWPSAFAADSWAQVPPADRDALRPLYEDEDMARFEQFGGYTGYRVLLAEDGTWTAFVAGD